MRIRRAVPREETNYAKSSGGKMEVVEVWCREQVGEEQVEKLEKLSGVMCEHNGYITVLKDCTWNIDPDPIPGFLSHSVNYHCQFCYIHF